MRKGLSYKDAGVDIDTADATKEAMVKSLETTDRRVLNRIGAYGALFDARFRGYRHPVLVLKMEEPGSKQKLAVQHGRITSICCDLVNHLIDDIIVMGATPLAVQDVIVCGKLERDVVARMVDSIARACREQGCVLTGGETSEQPGVVDAGTYVLAASIVGVVEKAKIIDGSKVRIGDRVIAVASNGLHTNGYSLVRALIARNRSILKADVAGEPFLEAVLKPHTCYYRAFRGLFRLRGLHGIAHVTGGGIRDNLARILPEGLKARIDLARIEVLPVFDVIRRVGGVPDDDMLRTFNLGVGMTILAAEAAVERIRRHLAANGHGSYVIGDVAAGRRKVTLCGGLRWPR